MFEKQRVIRQTKSRPSVVTLAGFRDPVAGVRRRLVEGSLARGHGSVSQSRALFAPLGGFPRHLRVAQINQSLQNMRPQIQKGINSTEVFPRSAEANVLGVFPAVPQRDAPTAIEGLPLFQTLLTR
jgi:hypothetical protein